MPLSANFYKLPQAAFARQLDTCDNYVEYAGNITWINVYEVCKTCIVALYAAAMEVCGYF